MLSWLATYLSNEHNNCDDLEVETTERAEDTKDICKSQLLGKLEQLKEGKQL